MKRFVVPVAAFLFPLLYYFRFVYPNSALLLLQNDFDWLYFVYKGYLADAVAHGHFPLWSPAEAGGYAFFGDPFTAPLYPLNVLPILTRLVVGYYNAWFHQIFTVLGVCLFALGLYHWLDKTYRRPMAALFTAMTLAASWAVADFMRFPNAIHALAWMPWVLSAIQAAHRSSRALPVYAGMGGLACQITAGYPYFVVYSLFVYVGYTAYLHWTAPGAGRLLRQVALLGVPVLVTFPYTSAVSEVMKVTADRAGGDFAFATAHAFGPVDLVGAFVFPPVCTVEGCCYAGILAVFLLVLYLWRGRDVHEKLAVIVGCMGLLGLIMGFRSYLFTPLWSFLPVVNRMRVFARMMVALVPLLAIAIHQGFTLLVDDLDRATGERALGPRAVIGVLAPVFAVQALLYCVRDSFNHDYLSLQARLMPEGTREIDFLVYTLLTAGVLLIAMTIAWSRLRHGRLVLFAILAMLVTQDAGNQGRFLWASPLAKVLETKGGAPSGDLLGQAWGLAKRGGNFHRLIRDYFILDRRSETVGLTADGLTKVPMPNFGFDSYARFYRVAAAAPHELDALMGQQKLFFHSSLHDSATDFLADVQASVAAAEPPALEYFDGDELRLSLTTHAPGHLSWIDNFDAGWRAEVDGVRVPIALSLTTFKSVALSAPGRHSIRFVYRPVLSHLAFPIMALGLAALGAFAWWQRRRADPRQPGAPSAARALEGV